MPIRNRIAELAPEISAWRRDIHTHPELQFDVHRTASLVAEKLRSFGADEVVEGIGKTGVVGVIHGRVNTSNKTVGLRADMDALPILEATGLSYASKTQGQMHACGHDGHTAMLLGASQYLCETRNFDGTVAVIFQPAEEGGGGGREMVKDGLMERFSIDEVFGMHNFPGLPLGQFAIRPGPIMAAADLLEIKIEGKGGHAAMPHTCVDTTLAAAQIVVALQSIASRVVNPLESVVISITCIETEGNAHNVIPQHVLLKGTVRTLTAEVRDLAEATIARVAENTAAAAGATAIVDYQRSYPSTVNAEQPTRFVSDVAKQLVGDANVDANAPPVMGGEDFSFMLNARPGAFIFIGNGDSANLHHPEYDFNDDAIPFGCSYWADVVEAALPR